MSVNIILYVLLDISASACLVNQLHIQNIHICTANPSIAFPRLPCENIFFLCSNYCLRSSVGPGRRRPRSRQIIFYDSADRETSVCLN